MPLTFKNGDIFQSRAEAICNAVNCVGVMGGGLAAAFKRNFPAMHAAYFAYCKDGILKPGGVHLYFADLKECPPGFDLLHAHGVYIFNVATKDDFIADSKYDWIAEGLKTITKLIREIPIKSVAIPALGCGLGCLDWKIVKEMIVAEATKPVEFKSIVDDKGVIQTLENWHDIQAEIFEPL